MAALVRRSTENIMRIARVEITRFRGFESFVLLPRAHVVVVGEPRAGRSDLIAALRRVLEPRTVSMRPSEWDVFRPLPEAPSSEGDEKATPLTSVEISMLELADETEQALQDRLELLNPTTGELADVDANDDAELGYPAAVLPPVRPRRGTAAALDRVPEVRRSCPPLRARAASRIHP